MHTPETETNPPTLLTEKDAARFLNLRVATLRRWRWAGKGPRFIKLGASVRYDEADLRDFVNSGRRSSTSQHHHSERQK